MRSTPNQLGVCCHTQHSEGERLYTMNTPLPRSAASDREVSTHVLQLLIVATLVASLSQSQKPTARCDDVLS